MVKAETEAYQIPNWHANKAIIPAVGFNLQVVFSARLPAADLLP